MWVTGSRGNDRSTTSSPRARLASVIHHDGGVFHPSRGMIAAIFIVRDSMIGEKTGSQRGAGGMRREPRAATVGAFNASWKSGSRVPWSARDGGRIAGNAERETRNGSLAPLRYNTRAPMTCICISPSRCLVIIAMGPLASCCYPGSPLLSGRSAPEVPVVVEKRSRRTRTVSGLAMRLAIIIL